MYYDRRICDELAGAIQPDRPLSWLMGYVRSAEGASQRAHLQFRRNKGDRKLGSVKLYWGRTSPLELVLRYEGRGKRHPEQVELHAADAYKEVESSRNLFSKFVSLDKLGKLECELRAHLEDSWKLISCSNNKLSAFVQGEAVVHAGLIRRYGHNWCAGAPLVVVDSEARIGFDNVTERTADNCTVRGELGLSSSESIPRKLDLLCVLRSGDLGLVEVKSQRGGIQSAIKQSATHAMRFPRLMAGDCLQKTVQEMIDQKIATGLIANGCPSVAQEPRIVPCIAAPDISDDRPASWVESIAGSNSETRELLSNALLFRLDCGGRILEVRPP